jgi:hypothetical protein
MYWPLCMLYAAMSVQDGLCVVIISLHTNTVPVFVTNPIPVTATTDSAITVTDSKSASALIPVTGANTSA